MRAWSGSGGGDRGRRVFSGVVVALVALASLLVPGSAAHAGGNGVVTFEGGGFGHSIGLSQYGAQGQALDGRDYQTIVEHYYTGASLVDLAAAVGGGSSPLLEYTEPLWLGAVSDVTSVSFIIRNGQPDICHQGGDCPIDPGPTADETWTVRVSESGVCIFEKDGEQQGVDGDCVADITLNGSQIEFPSIGKTIGHGTMRIRPDGGSSSADRIHVSFSMELDEYMLGIAEVPSSWQTAALRAQAVAARSFASAKVHQRETGTRASADADPALSQSWLDRCFCHLRATTSDQAYSGWGQAQLASWVDAVVDTGSEVMTHPNTSFTYKGVADTFYSSSTGGVTETNVGGFGSSSQFPYLVSVDDHWSVDPPAGNPFATWEKEVTESTILGVLAGASGRDWQISFDWLVDVEHLGGPPESWIRFTGVKNGIVESVEAPGWWLRPNLGLRSPQISGVVVELQPPPSGATWNQDSGTVLSLVEAGDRFGDSLATGDFDNDGFADAAIGAPTDGVNAVDEGGLVNVMYGSANGLDDSGNQMFHQQMVELGQTAEVDDHFGASLASGDFNGDSHDDLVVGVSDEDIGAMEDAGLIHVFEGGPGGLSHSTLVTQATGGVPGVVEAGDRFGEALETGDFNDDGYDDLVISAPGEEISGSDDTGNVTIVYGSSAGLDFATSHALHQGTSGVDGSVEAGDLFGQGLAAGDLDGDGFTDLIVGSPGEALGTKDDSGMLHVFAGSSSGLSGAASTSFHQGTQFVPGKVESGDRFGEVIAAGDIDGDNRAEVVIGVPDEAIGTDAAAGMVAVLDMDDDLDPAAGASYTQATAGIGGQVESQDQFGASLAIGDFTGGETVDLMVGAPGEAVGTKSGAGYLHVIPGSPAGLITELELSFTQSAMPSTGSSEAGDWFADALASGDFDGDGVDEGLIGTPGEDVGSVPDAGMVQTLQLG